jgi:hypothetical protein
MPTATMSPIRQEIMVEGWRQQWRPRPSCCVRLVRAYSCGQRGDRARSRHPDNVATRETAVRDRRLRIPRRLGREFRGSSIPLARSVNRFGQQVKERCSQQNSGTETEKQVDVLAGAKSEPSAE